MFESTANVVLMHGLQAIMTWFGMVAAAIGDVGLIQLQLGWVQTTYQTMVAVALSIFSGYVAWLVFSRYLMWSEGTADRDGMVFVKGVFRTMIYFVGSSAMVAVVYRFGLDLGAVILAGSLTHGVHAINHSMTALQNLGSHGVGIMMILVGWVAIAAAVVLLAWILVSMLYRSAELVVYFLAAPLVALGQLSPSGGAWEEWWKGLVTMSLAPAVQMLCLRGMEGSVNTITTLSQPQALGHVLGPEVGFILAIGLDCAWLALGVFGPNLMKTWAYHGGTENVMAFVSNNRISNALRGGQASKAANVAQASPGAGQSNPSGEV
jgi:hypothetical protein